jgi:putative flavoprotein involved in K+ transport
MTMRSGYVEEGSAFLAIAGVDLKSRASQARARQGVDRSTPAADAPERFKVIVIGGGQAGLSTGYHLARRGIPFVILDANDRIGDSWRNRWDSLRLFSPARFDGLDGMRFPARGSSFPTKDEMADYLEDYAERFNLPVRSGVKIDRLSRRDGRYVLSVGARQFEAEHVVVAMSRYQEPHVPDFARDLGPDIVQFHSFDYRNPSQVKDGPVLVVGASTSGADIAIELAPSHKTLLSGRHPGNVPFRIESWFGRNIALRVVFRLVFHRIFTVDTKAGRKFRPKVLSKGGPLIRVKLQDLDAAGVERVPRVAGVRDGRPVLDDGRVLDVANVIWCTGFHHGFPWIDLPIFDEYGLPRHYRGETAGQPGLYFIGLPFIYSFSSAMVHGVGRDAAHIAGLIASRVGAPA